MSSSKLKEARDFALQGGGSGMIVRGGKVVMSWGNIETRYDMKSTTKSMAGATALRLAVKDGKVSLTGKAQSYYADFGQNPSSNVSAGWLDDVTIKHLATHTAGFDKPGGYIPLLYQPGSAWAYSDGSANWLADILTVRYQQDLRTLLFNRVFSKIGITTSDLTWRPNAYREKVLNGVTRREFGSGIRANADAMARLGYLYLRQGTWNTTSILPSCYIEQAHKPQTGGHGPAGQERHKLCLPECLEPLRPLVVEQRGRPHGRGADRRLLQLGLL